MTVLKHQLVPDDPRWLRGCFFKGAQARTDGVSISRNPYCNDTGACGVTWNRARWRAWREGWEYRDQQLKETTK